MDLSAQCNITGYLFLCLKPAFRTKLHALTLLKVGGAKIPLHPDDIRYADDEREGYCYGGIQDRGHLRFDIFGDTFLKSVYAVSE